MEIVREKQDHGFTVRLSGRLDANESHALDTELQEIVRDGEHRIRLRMAEVGYISSAGIRILIKYAKLLRSLGGDFRVEQPSAMVAEVLELTQLTELLGAGSAVEPSTAADTIDSGARQYGRLRCETFREPAVGSLVCRLVGSPAKLRGDGFAASDSAAVSLPPGRFALGLGAFGTGYDDCRTRYGEFMAAAGAVVCLPSDNAKTPDYSVASGAMIPEVHVLYALVGEGPLPVCVRFETTDADGGVGLSEIVSACLDIVGVGTIGMVMVAETSGLIGASLRQSPALAGAGDGIFEHPAVREWISLTPERVCDRGLALVAGFASTQPGAALAPFVRPLAAGGGAAGHFHAAAFTYTALPKGAVELEGTVRGLFEDQALTALLHLLNDDRPIAGAGESLFIRGAIWLGTVTSAVAADPGAGKVTP